MKILYIVLIALGSAIVALMTGMFLLKRQHKEVFGDLSRNTGEAIGCGRRKVGYAIAGGPPSKFKPDKAPEQATKPKRTWLAKRKKTNGHAEPAAKPAARRKATASSV